ncbi:Ribokinase/fructokinase like protein, partial [Aduncisulcus paluster]
LQPHLGLIREAETLLMQLESPLETIELAAKEARAAGTKVILNPAPARALPDSLLANLDIITPNETEAELLTGVKVESEEDAAMAACVLHGKGVEKVLITLGEQGAFLSRAEGKKLMGGYSVKAVDTTAAG